MKTAIQKRRAGSNASGPSRPSVFSRTTGHMRHNVVAYLALFLALTGSAVAAAPLVTGAKVQDESLTGADVLNDSLKGADVDESSLGTVPSAANAAKATDATTLGTLSLNQVRAGIDADKLQGLDATAFLRGVGRVRGDNAEVAPKGFATSEATCPPGSKVTGGGWEFQGGPPDLRVLSNAASVGIENESGSDKWVVSAYNDDVEKDGGPTFFRAYALCAR